MSRAVMVCPQPNLLVPLSCCVCLPCSSGVVYATPLDPSDSWHPQLRLASGMYVTLREEDYGLRENLALELLPWSIMLPKVA